MVNGSSTFSLNSLENKLQGAISAGDYDRAVKVIEKGFEGVEMDEDRMDQKIAFINLIQEAVKDGKFNTLSPKDEALEASMKNEESIAQKLQAIREEEQHLNQRIAFLDKMQDILAQLTPEESNDEILQRLEKALQEIKQSSFTPSPAEERYEAQEKPESLPQDTVQSIKQEEYPLDASLRKAEEGIHSPALEEMPKAEGKTEAHPDIVQSVKQENDPFKATELWSDSFTSARHNSQSSTQYEYNESGFLVEKQIQQASNSGSFTDRVSQGRNNPSSSQRL